MKTKIRMTVADLRNMLDTFERGMKYNSMTGAVIVTISTRSDGRQVLQFEQPCAYAECYGNFQTFYENEKDYEKRTNERK